MDDDASGVCSIKLLALLEVGTTALRATDEVESSLETPRKVVRDNMITVVEGGEEEKRDGKLVT